MVAVLFSAITLTSCASWNNFWSGRPEGSVLITDYDEQMSLLRIHFPEVYNLYKEGKIVITEVYTYPSKNGGERVHANYRHL